MVKNVEYLKQIHSDKVYTYRKGIMTLKIMKEMHLLLMKKK